MKHPQMILAVENKHLQETLGFDHGITKDNLVDFYENIKAKTIFGVREDLEVNLNFRQLLPYILFLKAPTENSEATIVVYQRGKGVGENRLAGMLSVGFGGHVDFNDADISIDSVLDIEYTIRNGMHRELTEEVSVVCNNIPQTNTALKPYGVLIEETGRHADHSVKIPVGLLHVGLIYNYIIPSDGRLEVLDEELVEMGEFTFDQLVESYDKFEGWSKLVIDEFKMIKDILDVKDPIAKVIETQLA